MVICGCGGQRIRASCADVWRRWQWFPGGDDVWNWGKAFRRRDQPRGQIGFTQPFADRGLHKVIKGMAGCESHLGFCRVDVDIDLAGWNVKKQKSNRITTREQE